MMPFVFIKSKLLSIITGDQSSDAAFAMYYGKFQGIAPKANQIITLVESRLEQNVEYDLLLNEIHKMYLIQRAGVSSLRY